METIASFRRPAGEPVAPFATKTDAAYVMVRGRILTGALPAGTVVEQEGLARQLGLSTTPVREAMRRLEAEGLLHQVAHREMRVPGLTSREVIELYDVRLKLDPHAVSLGARNAEDAQRARVRELLELSQAGSSTDRLEHNYQLHRAMYVASDSAVLIEILDRLWDRSDRYRMILVRGEDTANTAHAEHEAIVEAFCSGGATTAGRLLREHLAAARDVLLKKVKDNEGG